MGHQAIGEAFGGKLVNLETVYHGVATPVEVGSREPAQTSEASSGSVVRSPLFDGLPDTIEVWRYHSWIVSDEDFPDELEVTARDDNNYIMGLQHKTFDVQGVQFHPESVLTPVGEDILRNWLKN